VVSGGSGSEIYTWHTDEQRKNWKSWGLIGNMYA
jgi:hypothetical protein